MKKLKKIYIVVLFSTMTILLYPACKKLGVEIGNTNITQVNDSNAALSNIPFADSSTLAQIAQKSGYASYITARKMAIIDMQMNINASMGWDGATLSQKPVVVYDGNSNPKYYEFIVLNQKGDAMGTITATAQKESDATVAYVLPYVRSYDFITTKSNSGYRMISNGYPNNIVIGIPTKSGDDPAGMIDPNTQQSVTEVVTEDAQGAIDVLKNMTAQELEEAMIDNVDQAIADIQTKDKVVKENAQEYWSIVDTLKAELDTMSDEYIVNALNTNKGTWTSYDQYIIPAYSSTAMQRTYWFGWCGPSAMAWICRGLYSSYKGKTITLTGSALWIDPWTDNPNNHKSEIIQNSLLLDGGLYADIAEYSNMYGGIDPGATTVRKLREAFEKVTNGQYTIGSGLWTIFNSKDHDHIRGNKLPVLWGCWSGFTPHVAVAFGSYYQYWNWDIVFKIFGKKITLAEGRFKVDQRLLVQDNGTLTHGIPFWKNDNFSWTDLKYCIYRR